MGRQEEKKCENGDVDACASKVKKIKKKEKENIKIREKKELGKCGKRVVIVSPSKKKSFARTPRIDGTR